MSSVWLIQNGNLYTSWPSLCRLGVAQAPPPPRNRGTSQQHAVDIYEVYSVSFKSDKPPEYKDALKNSKPISWLYSVGGCSDQTGALPEEARGYHKHQDLDDTCDCGKTDTCASNSNFRNRILSNSSVTQIAISMIRGFSHHATELPHTIQGQNEPQPYEENRRVSFYQLDVGQLSLSTSPPKYSHLQSAGLIIEEPACLAARNKAESSD